MNAPLKFDSDVPVTDECKESLKAMLQKTPDKRIDLITLIQTEYFTIENDDLEVKIQDNK